MNTIYYEFINSSSEHAIEFFENQYIPFSAKRMPELSREDLIHILTLSDQGFIDILKRTSTGATSEKVMNQIQTMSFSEGIDYILSHTEVLRSPIIFEKNNLLIGFNADEIRQFIPRKYRTFINVQNN